MNILNILEEIEKVDGEIYERLSPRRAAMKSFFSVGKKLSLAAMPLALGSMFQKAYGQTAPASVTDVLNFALALEYLEWNFYNHALVATPSLVPDANGAKAAITVIRDHERAHVNLLKGALNIASPTDPATDGYKYANFQFEAVLADVFTNYQSFLKVGTALEDTGVRAYKGQAGVLKGTDVLTTALRIHAVEARHAAHIRQMRRARGAQVKPWITGKDLGGLPAATAAIYAGEENTTQGGVEITNINGMSISMDDATEAFDEPLTEQQVLAIVGPFIR